MFCCSTGQVIPCCPLVKLYFSFIFGFTLKAWQGERLLGCFPQGIDLEECKDCARAASTFCSAADVWREPAHLYAAEWEWWACILPETSLWILVKLSAYGGYFWSCETVRTVTARSRMSSALRRILHSCRCLFCSIMEMLLTLCGVCSSASCLEQK